MASDLWHFQFRQDVPEILQSQEMDGQSEKHKAKKRVQE